MPTIWLLAALLSFGQVLHFASHEAHAHEHHEEHGSFITLSDAYLHYTSSDLAGLYDCEHRHAEDSEAAGPSFPVYVTGRALIDVPVQWSAVSYQMVALTEPNLSVTSDIDHPPKQTASL